MIQFNVVPLTIPGGLWAVQGADGITHQIQVPQMQIPLAQCSACSAMVEYTSSAQDNHRQWHDDIESSIAQKTNLLGQPYVWGGGPPSLATEEELDALRKKLNADPPKHDLGEWQEPPVKKRRGIKPEDQ